MRPVPGAVQSKMWTSTYNDVREVVEDNVYALVELDMRHADWFSIFDMVVEATEDQ